MRFYLGTHLPYWLTKTDVPLFISARRLRCIKTPPKAAGPWALDSGGFSELSMYGHWQTKAMSYATEVRKWHDGIGNMQWAAAQDWMCEPHILRKTRLTVNEHQRATVANYLLLKQLAPDLPWMPIIQGYKLSQYRDCIYRYADAGVALTNLPIVGVGSICRRQHTNEVARIINIIHGWGIKIHAFGLKIQGLRLVANRVESADSMAWSDRARRNHDIYPGCKHGKYKFRKHIMRKDYGNCANCFYYAMQWRDRVLRVTKPAKQKSLF
jgi:hypothetical protein